MSWRRTFSKQQTGLGVIHTSDLPYVYAHLGLYSTSGSIVYPTESGREMVTRQAEVGVRCEHRTADFEEQKYSAELGTDISDWLIFERCHSCKRDEVVCYWRRGGGVECFGRVGRQ
jgi:hypothetical protein